MVNVSNTKERKVANVWSGSFNDIRDQGMKGWSWSKKGSNFGWGTSRLNRLLITSILGTYDGHWIRRGGTTLVYNVIGLTLPEWSTSAVVRITDLIVLRNVLIWFNQQHIDVREGGRRKVTNGRSIGWLIIAYSYVMHHAEDVWWTLNELNLKLLKLYRIV